MYHTSISRRKLSPVTPFFVMITALAFTTAMMWRSDSTANAEVYALSEGAWRVEALVADGDVGQRNSMALRSPSHQLRQVHPRPKTRL